MNLRVVKKYDKFMKFGSKSNQPDLSLRGNPSHYPPTEALLPRSSKTRDNSSLQAKSFDCKRLILAY